MTTPTPPAAPKPAGTSRAEPRYLWTLRPEGRVPDGAVLAAVRQGTGRDPGSVPSMWPYYSRLEADGRVTPRLRAEHVAMTLYAVHQQSVRTPMHVKGVGFGAAVKELRGSDKVSSQAVDRRFNAAATATSLNEAAIHLRGLIRQLKQLPRGFDYSQLVEDLTKLQSPATAGGVRRRWGAQYFIGREPHDPAAD